MFQAFVPLLALVVATLSATAVSAANLTDVRVGVHSDHTRIVLETDGHAPYIVDAGEKEIIVHVDAAATAEAVTAKSPHLIWVKVEPTQIGADVRLQLKQPADVKALVLTGPDRIVLDLYPRKSVAFPLPAPELITEVEPAPTAVAEPVVPVEPEAVALAPEELAANAEMEQAAAEAEAETPPGPGEELAAETPPEAEAPESATPEASTEDVAQAPAATDEPAQSPTTPAAPAPSGSRFGSPYLLGAAAVALLVVFVFLRRRLRSAEKVAPRPGRGDEGSAPFEPPQRAVAVDGPSASGESLFDVSSESIGPLPKDDEALPSLHRAGADAGDDSDRRMTLLERRIEELVDAKDRLERQVAAQTEELRVQRAAIARTQRVLRTVAPRSEEEASGDPIKS